MACTFCEAAREVTSSSAYSRSFSLWIFLVQADSNRQTTYECILLTSRSMVSAFASVPMSFRNLAFCKLILHSR